MTGVNKPAAKKNLVLVHLESISNTILWQYRIELASIWELLGRSLYYTRFYASATSTTMSFQALMFGNDSTKDAVGAYSAHEFADPLKIGHMIRNFEAKGYDFTHFAIDNILWDKVWDDPKSAPPHFKLASDPDRCLAMCEQWAKERKKDGKNFFVLFQNDITHMASNDAAKARAPSFAERIRQGYLRLDDSVKRFFRVLEENALLENALVVFYGDHGDELWSHTLAKGFCHAIAPYSTLVWTPLFIYDNGKNAGTSDQMITLIDLREMLTTAAIPATRKGGMLNALRSAPFSGADVRLRPREFAFAQNLYALQLELSGNEKALTKGYAVTDGVYRLVVDSGGDRPKDGGLEFYYERLDPFNSRNLLDFFALGPDGDIVGFRQPVANPDGAFAASFTPETILELSETYRRLRRELHGYVRAKEAEALKRSKESHHVMPESAFVTPRKRLRRDYDE